MTQLWGSSRFLLRFLGDGPAGESGVGGGISNCFVACDFNMFCVCCNKLRSKIDDGDDVFFNWPASLFFCADDVCWSSAEGVSLLKTFKLISVVDSCRAWVGDVADGDDGTCIVPVPEPSDIARPSNWIDSVAVVMVSRAFC